MINENIRKSNNNKIDEQRLSVFIIYTLLTIFVYVLPYTKFVVPYIMAASLMLVSMPIIMLKRCKYLNFGIILIITSFLVFFVNLVSGIYPLTENINEMLRNIRFFIPVLWGGYSISYCNQKQRKVVICVSVFLTAYVMKNTVEALAEDIWVVRMLAENKATSTNELNAYRIQNVGGFEFSYMIGIVILCLVWWTIHTQKIKSKMVGIVLTVICYSYIIQTMYTTLLLLTVIGMVILIFINTKNPIVKLSLIAAGFGLVFGLVPLLGYLGNIFEGSLLSEKFIQIQSALTETSIEELGSRPQLVLDAIDVWIKSPIFGGYSAEINAHSLFFSILAQSGLIGIVMWILMYIKSWKMITSELKRRDVNVQLFHVSMIYLFVLAILNPIGYVFELTIMVFYIVPVFSQVVYPKKC